MDIDINHEREQGSEDFAQVMSEAAEKVGSALSEEKAYGKRQMLCGIASFYYEHALEYKASGLVREDVDARVVNTWKMHLAARGLSYEEIEQIERNFQRTLLPPDVHLQAFKHACVLVRCNGKNYLGDETFCQFMDGESGVVRASKTKVSGVSIDNPVIQELYRNGFIELTPENLRIYLRATVGREYAGLIPEVVEVGRMIDNCPLISECYENRELDKVFDK